MIKIIKNWWTDLKRDPIEKWLAASNDLVELEQRQKRLINKGKWI
jgi:hypothetical protein|tara:strand:- start:463 stop:597 length:135 start_codon:yes stop_codon:yes gene_type:complete